MKNIVSLPLLVLFCVNLPTYGMHSCQDGRLDLTGQLPFQLIEMNGPVNPALFKFYGGQADRIAAKLWAALFQAESEIRTGITDATLTRQALWKQLRDIGAARATAAIEIGDRTSGAGELVLVPGESGYDKDQVYRRTLKADGKYSDYYYRARNAVPGWGDAMTELREFKIPYGDKKLPIAIVFLQRSSGNLLNRRSAGVVVAFHPSPQRCRENTWVALDILNSALLNDKLTPQQFMNEIAVAHFLTMHGIPIQSDAQNCMMSLLEASVRARLKKSLGALKPGVDIYWEAILYGQQGPDGLRRFVRDYPTFYQPVR